MTSAAGPRLPRLFPPLGAATAAALFHGVPGGPEPPRDPGAWERDAALIVRERLDRLALAAAREAGIELPPTVAMRLAAAARAHVAQTGIVDAWAPEVVGLLAEASVPVVVSKGPGVAGVYADPSHRAYEDIDLLVSPDRFLEALARLQERGFQVERAPRDYLLTRCMEGIGLDRPDGAVVDLHHHVSPWIWGRRLSFERLAAAARPRALQRGTVPVAAPVHNLLISALQLMQLRDGSSLQLKVWRDLYELGRACHPDAAAAEARRCDLGWYLRFVVQALPGFARPPGLLELLAGERPSLADALRVRQILQPGLGSRSYTLGRLVRLPAPNAAAYVAGKLFPSRDFLRRRYGHPWSYPRWWRGGVARMSRARRDPPAAGPQDDRDRSMSSRRLPNGSNV